MSENAKTEGFWRRSENEPSSLPWPFTDQSWPYRKEFLARLDDIQLTALVIDYMGYSICRLCGRFNGASEFEANGWIWPEGLRHYIDEHKVRPSLDFEAFVMRADRE